MTFMSRRRRQASVLPETLDAPDAGFMAAVGAYVAAVLVAVSLTIAFSVGASAATIIGSIPSAATVGLIAGGMISGHINGFPERLGQGWRWLAVPFLVPITFAVTSLVALLFPLLAQPIAIVTGIGAVVTFIPASAIATMARTRYARAMAPGKPIATVPLLKPNRDLHWIGLGVVCFGGYGVVILTTGTLTAGNTILWVIAWGTFALYRGVTLRFGFRNPDQANWVDRILDTDWLTRSTDVQWLPELRIHEAGIAITQPMRRRFTPWTTVTGVRLTADELVVERRRRFNIRCDRAVIKDAERVYEEIEQVRTGSQDSVETLDPTTHN